LYNIFIKTKYLIVVKYLRARVYTEKEKKEKEAPKRQQKLRVLSKPSSPKIFPGGDSQDTCQKQTPTHTYTRDQRINENKRKKKLVLFGVLQLHFLNTSHHSLSHHLLHAPT
jgi:hypothetical protein